jgi:4-aminobutyrate aminotransferase-like enzyme
LDAFESEGVLNASRRSSRVIEAGLLRLKKFPFIANVRGEFEGMVWGLETADYAGRTSSEWANAMVLQCYRGRQGGDGIHLLGPLAKKVIRIAPPIVITEAEAEEVMRLMEECCNMLL